MATATTLKAKLRSESGKGAARKLRAQGRLPGVVYGGESETVSVSLDAHDAEHLFHSISVENTIVDLKLEGERGVIPVLVREIQVHPFKPDVLHVDLYRIQAGVKVEVEIPVHLLGVPEGVREEGGVLQQVIHDLPIRVLPKEIPETIEIDVTDLALNASIHVSDLEIGEGIEVLVDSDRTVATVAIPKVVEEPVEEEEELELEEGVEVVGEGEEEAEGEAAAEDEGEAAGDEGETE